ncbi:uncharacterized protein [Haliotis cracherodii]|uniref:uncharacterized protein n=1 Tax=Haliotis cracherodii TaxID=6455 RepID=UPI0039E76F5D
MWTQLGVLFFIIATVDGATTQAGVTNQPDSPLQALLLTASEGSKLKSLAKVIKDAIYYDVDLGGNYGLTNKLSQLHGEGHDLLVKAGTMRDDARQAVGQLQGQAPSYSAIKTSLSDLISTAGAFKLQAQSMKDGLDYLLNHVQAQDHSNDALRKELSYIIDYVEECLNRGETMKNQAEQVIAQLQGQGLLVG